jgi:NAD-dependent deacetylase
VISDAEHAAAALSEAGQVVALTGAGISVESGIPDFRSPGGLWSVFPPDEYATLTAFKTDPRKAWVFYRALAGSMRGKEPNAAHFALATLERHKRLRGVITQNIDRLHQAAGSTEVLELHGDLAGLRCLTCGQRTEPGAEVTDDGLPPPRCRRCDAYLKPDVVLFHEPVRAMDQALAWVRTCDLMLVVGTSAQVMPAAGLPARLLAAGGSLLEFNLETTDFSRAGLGPRGRLIRGPAGRTLPEVLSHLGL